MKKIVIAVLALTCAGVLLSRAADAVKPPEAAEETGVFIDTRGDAEEDAAQAREQAPPGIPASYGQCRGVMTDAGRNLLVFESAEDGTIAFVQINTGGPDVSWKLVGRIPRSSD